MTRHHGYIRILFGSLRRTPRVGGLPLHPGMRGRHDRAVARIEQAASYLYGRPCRRRKPGLLALLLVLLLTGVGAFAFGSARSAPHGPVVVREVEIVKEVEKRVVPEQSVPPILRKIALCESQNTHYDRQGNVLRGTVNPHDVGKYQINMAVWGTVAAQLGYDLYEEQGNEQMALYLLHHYGSMPWQQSAKCWVRK